MALFNITVAPLDKNNDKIFEFRISNNNIRISTNQLRISEINITEQEWLGNF